jgi:hypothetical protein
MESTRIVVDLAEGLKHLVELAEAVPEKKGTRGQSAKEWFFHPNRQGDDRL